MPIHTNKIGTFTFIDLVGTISLSQERLELMFRLGVEGIGARRLKAAGEPFTLRSINFIANFSAAKTNLATYGAAKGTVLELQRNSISYGNFLVLDVREHIPPIAVMNVVGGLAGGEQCRQEIAWTLIAWNQPLPVEP